VIYFFLVDTVEKVKEMLSNVVKSCYAKAQEQEKADERGFSAAEPARLAFPLRRLVECFWLPSHSHK
jgi:hypothetical protein